MSEYGAKFVKEGLTFDDVLLIPDYDKLKAVLWQDTLELTIPFRLQDVSDATLSAEVYQGVIHPSVANDVVSLQSQSLPACQHIIYIREHQRVHRKKISI